MSDNKFIYIGFQSNRSCLRCGGMHGAFGANSFVLHKSGLVVQTIYSFDNGNYFLAVSRVRTVCVASGLFGHGGQSFVGNNFTLSCFKILTLFYFRNAPCGNIVKINHVAANVAVAGFFAKEKTARGNTMF
jgi:hypothetical protein